MFVFEIVIALLLVGALLSLWAGRIGVPYPALLAFAGAGLDRCKSKGSLITERSCRLQVGIADRCGSI